MLVTWCSAVPYAARCLVTRLTLLNVPKMAKGCKIPVEVQQIIVRMSPLFKKEDIAIYSGVSIRSIERILHYFKTHGTVEGSRQGRHCSPRRHLRDIDVEVSVAKYHHFTLI
jgi:hypothetical protein